MKIKYDSLFSLWLIVATSGQIVAFISRVLYGDSDFLKMFIYSFVITPIIAYILNKSKNKITKEPPKK